MTTRSDRLVLAIEVLFGVLPVTIIGGGYAILGVVFGSASVLIAVRELAVAVFALWLGILALAAGGLCGIVGLWSMVALSARLRPATPSMINVALMGSTIGVLTAVTGFVLMLNGTWERRPLVAYLLAAPIVVVLHRRPGVKRLLVAQAIEKIGTAS